LAENLVCMLTSNALLASVLRVNGALMTFFYQPASELAAAAMSGPVS